LATVEDFTGQLSVTERSRAVRIASEPRREMWIRARGVLRTLLGSYLGVDPKTVGFTIGEHGRPALATDQASVAPSSLAGRRRAPDATRSPPPGPSQLSFNLSHSGGLALYGISRGAAVGVDLEVARSSINALAVAERAFGPTQARLLRGLEPTVRDRCFLSFWVRHEAALKCLGTGIVARGAGTRLEDLWVAELDVGPRAAAAVALEHAPLELQCFEFGPELGSSAVS
jgi:4'-phosphopantetheinyl transferase